MRYLSLLSLLTLFGALASDWPAYKADPARSSISLESLTFPLTPGWTYRAALPPQPAWKDPGRSLNSLDFDYAFQAVVSDGKVFFGSSADDTVRALDARSGAVLWQYTCGAPVRFAPHISNGRCYFSSDDGHAYCLNTANGDVIWRVRLALDNRQLIANGRLTSRWPCRSGVLVKNGVAYATAGMWPSEGIFVFALDAETGKEKWCNDTSCYEYIEYPHVPSASFGGPAPQGYLLADEESLFVTTGRGVPAAFDLKTGALKYYRADSEVSHRGGSWATLAGDTLFVTSVGWQPDAPPRLGESPEHPADSLGAFSTRTGREEWSLGPALKAVDPTWKQPSWRGQVRSGILGRTKALITSTELFSFGNDKADAWTVKGKSIVPRWSMSFERVYAEAKVGNALILGQDGRVVALSPDDGKELWHAAVDGQVRGIAIANGQLIVSTDKGSVQSFGPMANVAPQTTALTVTHTKIELPAAITQALTRVRESSGFALVIGGADARLAEALVLHCGLHVVSVLKDETVVQRERLRLLRSGSPYGSRITVQQGTPISLPFVPYLAALVVLNEPGVSAVEAYRILRPCGGVLVSVDGKIAAWPELPKDELNSSLIVRGKLPGAFDWNSKNPVDERVRWPLEFQWYGGYDGTLQKARHTRPRTPVAANGRMFVFGENTISAMDAYTGVSLWQRRLNGSVGMQAPVVATDDTLIITAGATTVRFDAATGRALEVLGNAQSAPPILNLAKPVKIDGAARPGASCSIELQQTDAALVVILNTQSREPARDDAWELAFDFRPPTKRVYAPGEGTFELVMNAWAGTLRAHPTNPYPTPTIEKLPSAVGSSRVQLSFKWTDLKEWLGEKPDSFAMSADCKLWHPQTQSQVLWDRPLVKGRTKWINDAEVLVQLAPGTSNSDPTVLSPLLPIPLKSESVNKDALAALPLHSKRRPDADLSDFGAAAAAEDKSSNVSFLPRAPGFELQGRKNPYTGQSSTLDYTTSYGCSGVISSAVIDFMRSGCIGLYDRQDDSGMRNISGIRSGCGQTILPAQGLMLYAEGTGNCLCTYNFATSLALAPSDRKRNEDWALFNDSKLESASLKHLALNFGAPGDRRDSEGVLWLGYPRQPLAVKLGNTIDLPIRLDLMKNGQPVRTNSDRRPVQNTEQPWIYGSAIKGLRKLQLDLQFYEPKGLCLSVAAARDPQIDGALNDACWNGFGGTPLEKNSTLWMRHSATQAHFATNSAEWPKGIWSFTIGDSSGLVLMQVNAAATGKVDAQLTDLRHAIPYCDKDGAAAATQIDLSDGAKIHAAWNKEGLHLKLKYPKDYFCKKEELTSVGMLIAPHGAEFFLDLAIETKTGKVEARQWKGAEAKPIPFSKANVSGSVEGVFSWEQLGMTGDADKILALAVRHFTLEKAKAGTAYPSPESRRRALRDAPILLRLAKDDSKNTIAGMHSPGDAGFPFLDFIPTINLKPVSLPLASAAVKTGTELSIPWQSLRDAGLNVEKLRVTPQLLSAMGRRQDDVRRNYFRSSFDVKRTESPAQPSKYTVRLHFAELDEEPSAGTYDVLIQGKAVLKGFNPAKESGGTKRALMREFKGIEATGSLELEFVPTAGSDAVPILNGLEVLHE